MMGLSGVTNSFWSGNIRSPWEEGVHFFPLSITCLWDPQFDALRWAGDIREGERDKVNHICLKEKLVWAIKGAIIFDLPPIIVVNGRIQFLEFQIYNLLQGKEVSWHLYYAQLVCKRLLTLSIEYSLYVFPSSSLPFYLIFFIFTTKTPVTGNSRLLSSM